MTKLGFNLILILQFFLWTEISPYLIHFPSTQNFNFCISNINHKRCGCGHIEGNISNISYDACIENISDLGRILAPSWSFYLSHFVINTHFFRQHSASIYGFVHYVCRLRLFIKLNFRTLLKKVGGWDLVCWPLSQI